MDGATLIQFKMHYPLQSEMGLRHARTIKLDFIEYRFVLRNRDRRRGSHRDCI
jgi:hypothetical protein